eukprot:2051911-Rhodomonas_salina.1
MDKRPPETDLAPSLPLSSSLSLSSCPGMNTALRLCMMGRGPGLTWVWRRLAVAVGCRRILKRWAREAKAADCARARKRKEDGITREERRRRKGITGEEGGGGSRERRRRRRKRDGG